MRLPIVFAVLAVAGTSASAQQDTFDTGLGGGISAREPTRLDGGISGGIRSGLGSTRQTNTVPDYDLSARIPGRGDGPLPLDPYNPNRPITYSGNSAFQPPGGRDPNRVVTYSGNEAFEPGGFRE